MPEDKIYVTKPSLPPLEELIPHLEEIWESAQVTNGGSKARAFERALEEFLNVPHVTLCCNGTVALLCALRACNLPAGSEVITTPYSFVATAGAILWAGLKPVFVDVTSEFNLDPVCVEQAIGAETSAILPVHCYGRPCDVGALQDIANSHDLRLIYDAAHAFGADCHCGTLLTHGDASIISFHGTKIFNTFEGGCIVSAKKEIKTRTDQLINFGFLDETVVEGVGINGKMSEFNAALGLVQLKYVREQINQCRELHKLYRDRLSLHAALALPDSTGYQSNYSYFPILVGDTCQRSRDELYLRLRERGIYSRRYFYPLIPDFPDYAEFRRIGELEVARRLSSQVLCLPIYADMSLQEVHQVCDAISEILESS